MRIISRLNIGGPAQHAILLQKPFQEDGWRSMLVSGVEASTEQNMLSLAQRHGVEVTRLASMRRSLNPISDLMACLRLVCLMHSYRPHIVHTHTAKAGSLGRLAARMTGVPVTVHTFHGHVLSGYFSPLATRTFILIERWLARATTCIVTLTPRLQQLLLGHAIVGKCGTRVVPLGLDLRRFSQVRHEPTGLRRELNIERNVALIGIVGRLVPIKRHVDLLDAVERMKSDKQRVHLAVIGGGELENSLREEIERRKLHAYVSMCGFRQDLENIYAGLDVVVLCSANEGMPVSLIEAMACGIPVVATEVGGVSDLLSDCPSCSIVPAFSGEHLAGAITNILNHYDMFRERAEAHRHVILERYSLENLVTNLRSLYRELLEGR